MPNGPTHRKITCAVAAVTSPVIIVYPMWVFVEAGILSTIWINPDLDIHNHAGKLGKILGYEFYRDAIPHRAGMRASHWDHENWTLVLAMSHVPWLGTIMRFLILAMPIILLAMWLQTTNHQFWRWFVIIGLHWWFGMGLADLFHFIPDWITMRPPARRVKKRRRYFRRGT